MPRWFDWIRFSLIASQSLSFVKFTKVWFCHVTKCSSVHCQFLFDSTTKKQRELCNKLCPNFKFLNRYAEILYSWCREHVQHRLFNNLQIISHASSQYTFIKHVVPVYQSHNFQYPVLFFIRSLDNLLQVFILQVT